MKRRFFSLAGVSLLLAATSGLAQEPQVAPAPAVPAGTRSEIDCSGFITASPVSKDLYVFDGEDNDFSQPVRMFFTGQTVFLRSRAGENVPVGSEFWLVRPAKELMRNFRYEAQRASIRSLGHAYEDVGKVKVFRDTPLGALAEVTFACGPIHAKDIAMPFQARTIPDYAPTTKFDRWALPNGNLLGAITAAANNAGNLGSGSIAYINLGEVDGVRPGTRFRVFRIIRDMRNLGFLVRPDPPRESLGEMVVLSTQEKSSVAIVVYSAREISLGDGIELQ